MAQPLGGSATWSAHAPPSSGGKWAWKLAEELSAEFAAPSPSAGASAPLARVPLQELDARFFSVEMSFRARRSALGQVGIPITIETEPSWLRAEFRGPMEDLSRLGCVRASAWLLRHFHAHEGEDPTSVVARKAQLYRRVLDRAASAEWIDSNEIDVLSALLLDAPTLGTRLTREFSDALREANPGRPKRCAKALRAAARSILGTGVPNDQQRARAAELWREALAGVEEDSFLARYASNELWRLDNFWVGDPAPPFVALDVDGNELTPEDFRNKVLVVAFFRLGSRADLAWAVKLRELSLANEARPVVVLGVELGTSESAFRRLLEENELRFPCVYEAHTPGLVSTAWRLNETPRSLVFDGAGRLRFVDLDGAALEETVESLLLEPGVQSPGGQGRVPSRRR